MFQVATFCPPRSFFRGVDRWAGLERATADYVGMLATVMNAICLQVWIVVASVSMMCWVDKSWVGMLATVMNAMCLQVRVNRLCWLVLLARLCKLEGGACRSLWSAAGTPALPRSAACRRRSHAAFLCRYHLLPCPALMSARLWPPPDVQSALEALGVQTRVQTAIEMREIAEPYIR